MIIKYKCEVRKPWPWHHSGWHPSPDSRPHCHPQSSHTGQKEVLLGNNNAINVGKDAKMQYVWILNDLLSPHAAGKGGKKRQTGTSAQSAPKKKIILTDEWSNVHFPSNNLKKWIFWISAWVSSNVSCPKGHTAHHHPLQSPNLVVDFFSSHSEWHRGWSSTWRASSANVEEMSPDQSPAEYLQDCHWRISRLSLLLCCINCQPPGASPSVAW